ncbi:DNA polymerase eta isoform X1 [Atheta coriaria]|uniref:DNA polymerase eta isoform X1 n=1 Tax=Dalotia coriaria TaxID=877792 RepID=UPI0031F352D5
MSATDRVVVLVDMDCFYCQVEQKLDPSLVGKPLAVVQYNAWKGGGLIAVNYEARAKGVTRHMRGNDAKAKCPEIELARVPTVRGKADLTRYREAGKRVAEVLQTFTPLLERASVDEAYLDITDSVNARLEMCIKPEQLQNTHVVGFDSVADFLNEINCDRYLNDSNVKLAVGGVITEEIRAAVYSQTGYRCSAGVGHNKILAKLTAGLHKPNKQTILPHESIQKLYENLSIKKIRSMGGKFGNEVMEKLHVSVMADLIKFSEKELQQHFEEKTANWLFNIARGINLDPVTVRLVSKSIGCCKRFPGRGALRTEKNVRHWTSELSIEIAERIEKDIEENNRKPKQLIVSYTQQVGRKDVASTRRLALNTVEQEKIYQEAYETVRKNCQKTDGSFGIKFLGLNVGKFEDIKNVTEITSFFKSAPKRVSNGSVDANKSIGGNTSSKINDDLDQLSRELHAVVQANLDLNQSFGENSLKVTNKNSNDNNFDSASTSSSKLEEVDDDDSEAELESINVSHTEANTSSASIAGKNSFFHGFLNRADVPKRDFNTSAILDEVIDDDKTVNEEKVVEETNQVDTDPVSPIIAHKTIKPVTRKPRILSMFSNNSPTTSRALQITDDNKELCPECNKLIPVENIVSHLDYHFAIKMVRDEAHLYKMPKNTNNENTLVEESKTHDKSQNIFTKMRSKEVQKPKVVKNSNNNNSSTRKRKSSELDRTDITKFFTSARNDGETDEHSEVCPDCCKRIKMDDIASHLDYHVAKKLHQQINQMNVLSEAKVISRNCDKSIKNTKSSEGKGAITTYFKKV